MKEIRRFVFALEGVTPYSPTPSSLLEVVGKEYRLYRDVTFEVRLTTTEHDREPMLRYEDSFVKRVLEALPQLSVRFGGPTCGKDSDFVAELERNGKVGAGHFVEHCLVVVFDDVSSTLGLGDHELIWRTKATEQDDNRLWTRYRTRQFHAIVNIPPELFGLEGIVFGWLNASYESAEKAESFGLRDRIDGFIQHRMRPRRRRYVRRESHQSHPTASLATL